MLLKKSKKVKCKVQVFDTPQVSTVLRSNLMRLYFPVDLTGNLIMIRMLYFLHVVAYHILMTLCLASIQLLS